MDTQKKIRALEFCAIDLETTGVNPLFHRIVEIGAVRFSSDGENSRFQSLVLPGVPIPAEVTAIHGITDAMVAGAPGLRQVMGEFLGFIEGAVILAHNPSFDLSFLNNGMIALGMKEEKLRAIDTVRLSRNILPQLDNHRLDTLSSYLNIPHVHHRALDDAVACGEIFRQLVTHIHAWDIPLSSLLEMHGPSVAPSQPRSVSRLRVAGHTIHCGREYDILYQGNSGTVTERRIRPVRCLRFGRRRYVEAWCYLRNEKRVFRADRIESVQPCISG